MPGNGTILKMSTIYLPDFQPRRNNNNCWAHTMSAKAIQNPYGIAIVRHDGHHLRYVREKGLQA